MHATKDSTSKGGEMKKLFEGALLVSFDTRHPGDKKSNKALANRAADHLGIDSSRYGNVIHTIPKNIMQRIRTPARHAREFMKRHTIIWSASRNDENGGRVTGGQYLLTTDKLVEFESGMNIHRQEWEDRKRRELFAQYDRICEKAPTALNDAYDEKYFPPLDELKKQFEWNVTLTPLWDVNDISNDVRLKASSELVNNCIEEAQRDQSMKISNAIGSVAENVIELTSDIAERMEYDPDPKDKRKGNNLPKAPTWKKLSELTDTLESVSELFEDDDLTETVTKMRQFESHVQGMGDAKEIRETLQGDESERETLKDKTDEIQKSASRALNKFDAFMGG